MSRSPDGSSSDTAPSYADAYAEVDPDDLVRVGFVYRPHGVHGEIKVDPEDTGDPTRYETWDQVFVGPNRERVTQHAIAGVRYQETKRGTTVILTLEGIDSRDDAEVITKSAVFVREDVLDLEAEEVFIHDLIGLDVQTEEGAVVGTVINLLELPAHDVLVVRRSNGQEAMIPAVDDFVLALDLEAGHVTVRPIEGMID
jgi:16S rRNA processing protein RimM